MKIVHTALRSLFDDLGREQHDVKTIVAEVLAKLPGEHDIRAIDISRVRRDDRRAADRGDPTAQVRRNCLHARRCSS